MLGGALLFGLTMSLTSCEDVLGHWEKPSPNPITPGGGTPVTPEEIIYAFSLRNMADDADITAGLFKLTDQNGTEIAYATSDGKYTIKADDLSSVTTLWLEVTSNEDKKYIAKATVEELPAIAEAGKLKMATIGDVILSDGKFAVDGTEGQLAKIAYLGDGDDSDATYNHGLALALKDVSGTKTWCSQTSATCLGAGRQFSTVDAAKTDMAGIDNTDALVGTTPHNHGDNAAKAAREFKYKDGVDAGAHPTGTSAWFLPSAGQWDKMITAAGGYANLSLQAGTFYWLSTEYNDGNAWDFEPYTGWYNDLKNSTYNVRACLAF